MKISAHKKGYLLTDDNVFANEKTHNKGLLSTVTEAHSPGPANDPSPRALLIGATRRQAIDPWCCWLSSSRRDFYINDKMIELL